MFPALFEQLRRHEDLTTAQAADVMGVIMDGQALPTQIAGLLMALALKGERAAELVGFAQAMRARALVLPGGLAPDVFDTCGTGGDGAGTFNVSTAAAIVAAGAGVRVAKHGNRAVSSRSGSADVFEALGVKIDAAPERVAEALQAGLAFFFAPVWHPSMRHAGPIRRELGVRTAFNLVGPLTNPAGAGRQIIGVSRPEHAALVADTLRALGVRRAWVVHGEGGLDEISTLGRTAVVEVDQGATRTFHVHPSDVALPVSSIAALSGGTAADNAVLIQAILDGESGPRRDIVLLNAGAAILVSGRAESLEQGVTLAAESVSSGRARQALDTLRSIYSR